MGEAAFVGLTTDIRSHGSRRVSFSSYRDLVFALQVSVCWSDERSLQTTKGLRAISLYGGL